jgi:mono/diheme cytochrome c family protein
MKTQSAVRALKARPIAAIATLIAFASLGNALIVGCGGNQNQTSSTSSTPSTTPAPAPESTTTSMPSSGSSDASVALGDQVYKERCVLCHGPLGKGDGPGAAALNPKPRNHTDGAYMNARTDEQLLEVIRTGKGNMPAWGKILTEEQIQAVLKHVRSLAVPPYPGKQG